MGWDPGRLMPAFARHGMTRTMVVGQSSVPCGFSAPDELVLAEMGIAADVVVEFCTGAVAVSAEDVVTVDGQQYKVRHVRDDAIGSFSRAWLKR